MAIDLKEYIERLEEPEDREAVANMRYQRELFEEYAQRGENFPQLRAQLLEQLHAGAELTGPRAYGSSSARSTSATLGGPTSPTTLSDPRLRSTRSSTASSGTE